MRTLFALLFLLFFGNLKAFELPTKGPFLLEYELLKSYDRDGVREYFNSKDIPKFIAPNTYAVDVYEVVYLAPWVDGSLIKASGLYFVAKTDKAMPLAVYHHGTQLSPKREAFESSGQQGLCFGMAADGYHVLMPDYYGIGKGEKMHLYQHAWSEAMSTIYMLYAIEELNVKINAKRNDQLFLTGYSQGGHATMAAHKYLEELNDPRFQVTASSPMSGAYDMSGAQAKVMFEYYTQPFYLPYLLVSYQEAYNVWPGDIYEVFKSPYDTIIPQYLYKDKSYRDLNKVLPNVPADMLKEALVKEFQSNPDFAMRKRIEENDLIHWVPKAPVLLTYSEGDEQVSYKNALVAHDTMTANGAEYVKLKRVSTILSHNGVAMFAIMDTRFFFDSFRKGNDGKKIKGPFMKRTLINMYKKKKEKEAKKKIEEKKKSESKDLRAQN